jgi:hypothetical protein
MHVDSCVIGTRMFDCVWRNEVELTKPHVNCLGSRCSQVRTGLHSFVHLQDDQVKLFTGKSKMASICFYSQCRFKQVILYYILAKSSQSIASWTSALNKER